VDVTDMEKARRHVMPPQATSPRQCKAQLGANRLSITRIIFCE
jgi:hypothetical protein